MLTKYILTIDNQEHELTSEHIRNWDQIKCAYSRKDYNGVVRSFTSQFEFVGIAYDLLLELYLKAGINAEAELSILTITDRWEWEEQFRAPLDFSTITWDGLVLGISAIDNGLAALINANKSTKYEFLVGTDIVPDYPLNFDRMDMQNSVVHELMGDDNGSDRFITLYSATGRKRSMVYMIGDPETYENSPVYSEDQTQDDNSYFIKVKAGQSVKFKSEIVLKTEITNRNWNASAVIEVCSFTDSNPALVTEKQLFHLTIENWERTCVGVFDSFESLQRAYPNPPKNVFAIIGSGRGKDEAKEAYFTPGSLTANAEWCLGEIIWLGNQAYCSTYKEVVEVDLKAIGQDTYFVIMQQLIVINAQSATVNNYPFYFDTKFTSSWSSHAQSIYIDALSPANVAKSLLNKIADGKMSVNIVIDSDPRLNQTYLLAAESIRGISNAKFYSSFNEFCNWMEAVFGYTYYLGDLRKGDYKGIQNFYDDWSGTSVPITNDVCPAAYAYELSFLKAYGVFAVYNAHDGKFYSRWESNSETKYWTYYNDEETGKARRDYIYRTHLGKLYSINENYELVECKAEDFVIGVSQDVHFIHRDKLFSGSNIRTINYVRDVSYQVDNAGIYSTIEVGYDKKDYDAECGRDEWNFTATFTTGTSVSDKTLSLKSKYRADCYGIEFLSQKRAQDSTDDKSDNDVFFVHCKVVEEERTFDDSESRADGEQTTIVYYLKIDRSVRIVGALSDTVFNGEYSPHRCLMANAAFLAKMCNPLHLKFASSDGNSDVVINNVAGNSDITLDGGTITLGELSFTTGEVDFPDDPNALITFTHQGITYSGFLLSMEQKYAHEESAKYKLIVKDIKQ